MKIKSAIFDLDGTLLDTMRAWRNLGETYLEQKGVVYEKGLKQVLEKMTLEESAEYFREKYKISDSAEKIVSDINGIIRDFYYYDAKLKEGAYEFLHILKENNVKISLATASGEELSKAALKQNGVLELFDAFLFSCNKRESEIYEKAASLISANKEECVVFEDALHAVKSAQKAGFKVCGVYEKLIRPRKRVAEISDFYIKSFKEAENLFTF